MPNVDHLKILEQGVEAWNKWRFGDNPIIPDLSFASLAGKQLRGINLEQANLEDVHFEGANLSEANLFRANLRDAKLAGANLSLVDARFANLEDAFLPAADLSFSSLQNVNFSRCILSNVDFTEASVGLTIFAINDLSSIKGLDTVRHDGPSTLGLDVLAKSRGRISDQFLRGCGLADWEIELAKLYQRDLSSTEAESVLYRIFDLRASQPIQINKLFISYSRADGEFVDRLEELLNTKGIRFWRDTHDATSGRLEKQIDRAIRLNPIVLVVLSCSSTQSDWVEHEVRLARKLEKEIKRDVLCPIALDDSWKTCPWPERLREQIKEFNILDFSNWSDSKTFERMFQKLIDGINLFYRPESD